MRCARRSDHTTHISICSFTVFPFEVFARRVLPTLFYTVVIRALTGARCLFLRRLGGQAFDVFSARGKRVYAGMNVLRLHAAGGQTAVWNRSPPV